MARSQIEWTEGTGLGRRMRGRKSVRPARGGELLRHRILADAGIRGETPSRWVIWCAAHVPTEIRER